MANVLPQKERKRFEMEYKLRLVVVILALLSIAIVFGAILLLPSFFVSQLKEESIMRQSELLQRAIAIRESDTSTALLVALRSKVEALEAVQGQVLQTKLIETISQNTDASVTVDAFYYTRGAGGGESQLKITGRAATRTALISFVDRLKQESLFSMVDLPVSNLAKDSNIVFSITLEGEF